MAFHRDPYSVVEYAHSCLGVFLVTRKVTGFFANWRTSPCRTINRLASVGVD